VRGSGSWAKTALPGVSLRSYVTLGRPFPLWAVSESWGIDCVTVSLNESRHDWRPPSLKDCEFKKSYYFLLISFLCCLPTSRILGPS
jgi:hypothetical protein